MILKGGYLYYDTPVGIICLDTKFPKPVGHMRNPLTYNFPVVQRVIKDVGVKEILSPSPELIEPFIEAVKQLEQDGVKCITGSCGFMALFQKEIAAAVKIPVLLSSLIQIPLVRVLCGPKCKIGVLTASASSLTPKHFERVGAEIKDVFIKGMEGYSEFRETIIEGKRNDIDMDKLEKEICHAARELVFEDDIDALVLECTDLSAFAYQIQKAIQRPVFDINSLVEYAKHGVCRKNHQ